MMVTPEFGAHVNRIRKLLDKGSFL
jgi:hypothetical protein